STGKSTEYAAHPARKAGNSGRFESECWRSKERASSGERVTSGKHGIAATAGCAGPQRSPASDRDRTSGISKSRNAGAEEPPRAPSAAAGVLESTCSERRSRSAQHAFESASGTAGFRIESRRAASAAAGDVESACSER